MLTLTDIQAPWSSYDTLKNAMLRIRRGIVWFCFVMTTRVGNVEFGDPTPSFNDKKMRTEGRRVSAIEGGKKTTEENIWRDRLPPRGEALIKIKS